MESKTIVFIGGTSGIGQAAVRYLLERGHKVILLYRSEEKLAETIKGHTAPLLTVACDLYSFDSMSKACETICNAVEGIDILVCNAGMWEFGNRKETQDGIETTFQVNVLAPAFFQEKLKPLLLKRPEPKVITTASALHSGNINFEDLEYKNKFSGFQAYRQSKLSVVLLTRLWARQNNKIQYYSLHPGVVSTELGRSAGWFARTFFKWMGISSEKGAETLLYLIETPSERLSSGDYYAKKKLTKTISKVSYDLKVAARLEQAVQQYLSKYFA